MSETISSQRWTWNDATNTLEIISNNPALDRQDRRRRERREPRYEARSAARVTSRRSPLRQGIKQTADHLKVTLQDVKSVAESMMKEVHSFRQEFLGMYKTSQFDEFLMYLLNYFHWFFEKQDKENITNPVHIEPSIAEKRLYEELCAKLIIAKKQLGHAYGMLVLGIGLREHHHMECGKLHHSLTRPDRIMYETMYSFCSFFVWIAFRRRDYDAIKMEINRMLRTEHFYSHSNRQAVADDDEDLEKEKTVEHRNIHRQSHQTPLKTILSQRSSTVTSIMPLPKEDSEWLFKRQQLGPSQSIPKQTVEEQLEQNFKHLDFDETHLQLGIIGEPLNLFDAVTLSPVDNYAEEKEKLTAKPTESAAAVNSQNGNGVMPASSSSVI